MSHVASAATTDPTPFALHLDDVHVVEKAGEGKDSKPQMWIRGFCSTDHKDYDKESVPQDILDFAYILNGDGGFRWKHTPKNQSEDRPIYSKVGKPKTIERRKTDDGRAGTWVEGPLYDTAAGREIFELGLAAQAVGDSLGMSIEGNVVERNATGKATKARIKNIAIDPHPVNRAARAEMYAKFSKALGYDAPTPDPSEDDGAGPDAIAKAAGCGAYGKPGKPSKVSKADDDETGFEPDEDDAKPEPEPFSEDEDAEDDGGVDDSADDPAATIGKAGRDPKGKGKKRKKRSKTMTPQELNELLRGMSAADRAAALSGIEDAPARPEEGEIRKALGEMQDLAEQIADRFGAPDAESALDDMDGPLSDRIAKALDAAQDTNHALTGLGQFMLSAAGVIDASLTRTDQFMAKLQEREDALNKALGVVSEVGRLLRIPSEPKGAITAADVAPHPADKIQKGGAGGGGGRLTTVKRAAQFINHHAMVARGEGNEALGNKIGGIVEELYQKYDGNGSMVPVDEIEKAMKAAGWQS